MSAEDYGDRVTRFGAAMSQRFRNLDMRPDVGEFPRKYLRRARRRYRQTAGAGYEGNGLSHERVSAAWMPIVVVVSKFDVVPSEQSFRYLISWCSWSLSGSPSPRALS